MSQLVKLMVYYTDDTVLTRTFRSRREAHDFIYKEGDHVVAVKWLEGDSALDPSHPSPAA